MKKEYRFFISSTFKDMQKERDILREEVFPELELYAKKYGVYISIVDLTWGIQTEDCENDDEASFKIFKTCFEEIDESKPFFIGLLGDRYGWIPDISKLPLELDSKYRDFIKYSGKSITEVEMLYAMEKYGLDKDASFIYAFRNIKNEVPASMKDLYLSSSNDDSVKIQSLKDYILKNNPTSCFSYDVTFNDEKIDLKDFSSKMFERLKSIVDKLNETDKVDNPIKSSLNNQEINIEYEHNLFAGRTKELEYINDFFNTGKLLSIKGSSGIGKSALTKEFIYNLKTRNKKVIYSLLGFDNETLDCFQVLSSLIYQVKQIEGSLFDERLFNKDYIIENYTELINEFSFELRQLSTNEEVYIVLDALDQLDITNETCLSFLNTRYFLNEDINIKILVSCIEKEYINTELILKGFNSYELKYLDINDSKSIILNRLKRERKELNNKCMNSILAKKEDNVFCATRPLYLVMLIQLITNLNYEDFAKIEALKDNTKPEDAIYSYINEFICNLPKSIEGEFEILVLDAKKRISDSFVFNALGIISMSRNGLREDDIEGIFNILGLKYTSFDFYYLKKLFRAFISFKANYYNFNHKVIDDILENYYFNLNKDKSKVILDGTIKYLDSLDYSDEFKKKEYLYYCLKAYDIDSFNKYLINHLENDDILCFYELFNEDIDQDFLLECLNIIPSNVIELLISNIDVLNSDNMKKFITILLNLDNLSYENTCLVYVKLAELEYELGNLKDANIYSKMAYKMSLKRNCHANASFDIRFKVLNKNLNMISLNKMKKSKLYYESLDKDLSTNSAYIGDDLNMDSLNDNISLMNPQEIYDNSIKIEEIISKNNVDSNFINTLVNIEEENYLVFINKDSNSILALAYLELLIGKLYLVIMNKDDGIKYLTKSYKNYNSIDDLIDKRDALANYSLCVHLLNKFKIVKSSEVKRIYKKYNSKGENQTYREKISNIIVDYVVLGSIAITYVVFMFLSLKHTILPYMSHSLLSGGLYISFLFETITFILFYPAIYYLYNYIIRFNKYDYNGIRYKKRTLVYSVLEVISSVLLLIFALSLNEFYEGEVEFLGFNCIYGGFILVTFVLGFQALRKKRDSIYEMVLNNYFKLKLSIKYIVAIVLLLGLFAYSFKVYDFSYIQYLKNASVADIFNALIIYGLTALMGVVVIFFIVSMIIVLINKKKYKKVN